MVTEAIEIDPPIRPAVQILMERMEAFPEEFLTHGAKFGWVANMLQESAAPRVKQYNPMLEFADALTPKELAALREKFKSVLYAEFHNMVMRSLVTDERSSQYVFPQGTSIGGLVSGSNGTSINNLVKTNTFDSFASMPPKQTY